ncbi:MAG: hypothetical protein ACR2G4_10590 [Pyrinomonadaceae bacterium]
MYCQMCAAELQPGLNYCNRCGAAVNSSAITTGGELVAVDIKSPVRTIGVSICLTTLVGLAILFLGLAGLATTSRPLPPDVLIVVSAVGFITLGAIVISLMHLLSRLMQLPTTTTQTRRPAQLKPSETKELPSAQAGAYLPLSSVPGASVTEHTTRTFHPVYKEPPAKG